MHTNVKKVIKIMESIAPIHLAESWDNVGLLVGRENKMVENILLALEVTEGVIDEAIEKNVDLIITHHPLIFKPLKKINDKDPIGKMVLRLIENNINLYSAHTNLDSADEGTSYLLANQLMLDNQTVLDKSHSQNYFNVQVYVPSTHADQVRSTLTKNGLGEVGDYSECTFNTQGKSTFKPGNQSKPFIGNPDELEIVEETKIEGIVSESKLSTLIDKLIKVHPYEVPAYNIIKLNNTIKANGIGIVGHKQTSLLALNDEVKKVLKSDFTRVVGELDKKISRVAIVTGAGSDYIKIASKKADVLITGDIKYHEAHLAKQLGLMVIDAGHFETEVFYMDFLKDLLERRFELKSYDIQVSLSSTNINPFEKI